MKRHRPSPRLHGPPGLLLRLALFVSLATLVAIAPARAQTQILALLSNETEAYLRFSRQLQMSLNAAGNDELKLTTKIIGKRADRIDATKPYDLCLSVGIAAAEYLSLSHSACRQIHAFVPRLLYQRKLSSKQIRCPEASCKALVIDQPLERQLGLVKLALPHTRRLAVVLSSYSEALLPSLRKAAQQHNISLNTILLRDSDEIVPTVNDVIENAQALLASPDPLVFNRYTARSILLSTYRAGLPVIAYSSAYVRAGALLGIYSTPEQIAKHAAELIQDEHIEANTARNLVFPKYFTLKQNDAVAQSLGIQLPPLQTLKSHLQGADRE